MAIKNNAKEIIKQGEEALKQPETVEQKPADNTSNAAPENISYNDNGGSIVENKPSITDGNIKQQPAEQTQNTPAAEPQGTVAPDVQGKYVGDDIAKIIRKQKLDAIVPNWNSFDDSLKQVWANDLGLSIEELDKMASGQNYVEQSAENPVPEQRYNIPMENQGMSAEPIETQLATEPSANVLQQQDSNEVQQPAVNVEQNRNAAMKEIRDFHRKAGNLSRYNNVDYVMLNGRAVPLFQDVNTILGADGKYHQFDADGNVMNDEYAGKYNLAPGSRELMNNMFDYFDAHGFDPKSVYNTDFMVTEGGNANMYELAKSLGVENVGRSGWKRRLLDKVKEEYDLRNSDTNEAQGLFDQANMPVAKEPVVNKDSNGNDDIVPTDETNEFFAQAKKFHTTQADNPSMYSHRQQYVKDFQKYMADFMEKHPAIKEKVQNEINWRGKDGKEFFPIDGNYGQNTTSVMFNILDMIGGEDAVEAFGGHYNPETDTFEPVGDNDSAREYYEGLGLTQDERHEKKRLERQQKLTNMANILSGIGDTISGSQGVQVKDKSEEMTQEAELINQKIADNRKDYKDRMDALRKRFDDARTEKQKQAAEIAMAREKMKHDSDEAALNREFEDKMQKEKLAWQGEQSDKEIAARLQENREANATRLKVAQIGADASVAAAGGKIKMNNVANLGSTTIMVTPDSEKNFYNSLKSHPASYYFPDGMQIPASVAKKFNTLKGANDSDTQTIIESIYNTIKNDSVTSYGSLTKQQVLDYFENQVLQVANAYSSRYQSNEQPEDFSKWK